MEEQGKPEIILKEDTAVELGPPGRSSFQTVSLVQSPFILEDGLITLVGPDLPEARGRDLPFGQVLWVAGEGLKKDHLRELERKQLISNRLPGYMVRWAGGRIWARVGLQALERGFSFETIGRYLMVHYRRTFSAVQGMEILFVTSSDADVTHLRRLSAPEPDRPPQGPKREKLEGCTLTIDCEDCPNKPVCDRIREMAERFEQVKDLDEEERKRLVQKILFSERTKNRLTKDPLSKDLLVEPPGGDGKRP
jgi:hypothetical protein